MALLSLAAAKPERRRAGAAPADTYHHILQEPNRLIFPIVGSSVCVATAGITVNYMVVADLSSTLYIMQRSKVLVSSA
ncbi:putative membrane protein (plasmid) [Rhizobium favelukesii]|uniref:Membrane protein n=1 Tax=Rhizobium favelukesii TaxID=348824 RepID=W6RJZ8_9HYPH|nr:putative membrane protein [Rhizobium favelukesii]